MAILVKSTTALAEKNRLSTTWKAFRDAEALYGKPFSIDVCAEPETAKCPTFFCSPDWFESARSNVFTGSELVSLKGKKIVGFDALQLDWPNDWWFNPPFDRKQEFITHAHKQAKAGRSGMMLLPYEAITGWWRRLVEGKANAVYIPDGRYHFYEIDGETERGGVNFGSVFVLFTPHFIKVTQRIDFERYFATKDKK